MTTVLIGGGSSATEPDPGALYGPFLAAAGPFPSIACVVVDEQDGSVERYLSTFGRQLTSVGACEVSAVRIPVGERLSVDSLAGHDGLLMAGGLTPAYADALGPAAADVRSWLANRPYLGYSAGSAVAATQAVVGGFRWRHRVICPPDSAEDLEDISIAPGLGLVPFAVDVHAAQWGTLGRLCTAVAAGLVPYGVAIDEDTAVVVTEGRATVAGSGAAHVVRPGVSGAVSVESVIAGGSVPMQ